MSRLREYDDVLAFVRTKRHKHTFTALWAHCATEHHYHPCVDEDCNRVLVGKGRDCSGQIDDHWRETW